MSEQIRTINWLHLTDLHIGRPTGSQTNAINSLVRSIGDETRGIQIDLLLLTGDLAYSGKEAEYEELEERLLRPILQMDAFLGCEVVAVPGNHDLDCNEGMPIAWDSLGSNRQEIFFHSDANSLKLRSARAAGFTQYSRFVQRNGIRSVDPTVEVASTWSQHGDPSTTLILTASCFFSDKDVDDEHKAPSPVPAVRPLLLSSDTRRVLVLGHHPLGWFIPESAAHYRSALSDAGAVYLNGHEHQVKVEFSGRGLQALGFGAVYQGGIDSERQGNYRNSYAICHLEDRLHIKVVSWDHEHGNWRNDHGLPADFREKSAILSGGYEFDLPTTKLVTASAGGYSGLAASLQQSVSLERCVWLATNSPVRWAHLLSKIGHFGEILETYAVGPKDHGTGQQQFRVKDRRGNHLVYSISAPGNILTYDQLQSLNTELDTQGYAGCVIATLGQLSDEASTLATQLKAKKPIVVYERDHILRQLATRLEIDLKRAIVEVDPAEVKHSLIISDDDIGVLRQDRVSAEWFEVLNGKGVCLEESDPRVGEIRRELPLLEKTRYRRDGVVQVAPFATKPAAYDIAGYLAASHNYFDDVKYAPLAALGMRFRNASLTEIYVNANADASESSRSGEALSRAVEEFIESLGLPRSQRDQLEAQLRARFSSSDRSAEVGAARQLYQRFGNVLVLGDPGSGKTCFVKNEILAYCKPPEAGGSWYSAHIPIYISLAEAARLATDPIDIAYARLYRPDAALRYRKVKFNRRFQRVRLHSSLMDSTRLDQ